MEFEMRRVEVSAAVRFPAAGSQAQLHRGSGYGMLYMPVDCHIAHDPVGPSATPLGSASRPSFWAAQHVPTASRSRAAALVGHVLMPYRWE